MRKKYSNRTAIKTRAFARRLARNIEGVAAVEFAMIAPIMLMLLIGTLEMGTAYTIDRRVSAVASAVADLVSRETDTMTDTKLYVISDKIARSILQPYDFGPIKIHVVNVHADPNAIDTTTVDWSRSYSANDADMASTASPYPVGTSFPMPVGLLAPGTYLIAVEVTYDFTPFVFNKSTSTAITGSDAASTGAYQMRDIFYLSPRELPCIQINRTACTP